MENPLQKKLFIVVFGILIFILFFLILIINLLSNKKNEQLQKNIGSTLPSVPFSPTKSFNQKSQNQKPTLTPSIPPQFTGVKEEEIPKDVVEDANQSFELRGKLPLENEYFQLDYDYKQDTFVVFLKNNTPQTFFFDWLEKNYPGIKKERFKFADKSSENISPSLFFNSNQIRSDNEINQHYNPLFILLNLLFNLSETTPSPSIVLLTPTSLPLPSLSPSSPPTPSFPNTVNGYIYFSQSCYGINSQYCRYPLPGNEGCRKDKPPILATAGCGPVTVAMIIANLTPYKNITPPEIAKKYRPDELNCEGSHYQKALKILTEYNLKVGNSIFAFVPNGVRLEKVVEHLKKYQKAGATFFTLAQFYSPKEKRYLGHFFWIVKIDEKNNIWTLDPYYGRNEVPYNQNTRYPEPLYKLAFPVYKD